MRSGSFACLMKQLATLIVGFERMFEMGERAIDGEIAVQSDWVRCMRKRVRMRKLGRRR